MKSSRQPRGPRAVATIILVLLLSSGPESCARYFCTEEIYSTRNKSCSRQRRRYDEFMQKLQKKICEKIYSLIKMRLRVKKLNIDNPCND